MNKKLGYIFILIFAWLSGFHMAGFMYKTLYNTVKKFWHYLYFI